MICYFSASSYEDFRADRDRFSASDLGTHSTGGSTYDPRASAKSCALASIWRATRLRRRRARQRRRFANDTRFPLTAADQLLFNRFLAAEAHSRNLAVGLKNDLDQIPDLVGDFDFAVNEQCHEFEECDLLAPFVTAGKPVFAAEYDDRYVDDAGERDRLCSASLSAGRHMLVLPLDLDDSFRFS